ncbi:MAG TPA: FmdB family zinc ribbon protein [Burkholderiaceae bacterium]|nr:FmdB family zinc ribbon protein [Burkholderiaceae bacterium]
MPIYAYHCAACGHDEDVLQKLADAPLTQCTACGASAFAKKLTAPGFQLKGSGWYVTDFRNNGSGGSKPAAQGADDAKKPETAVAEKGEGKPAGDSKPASDSAAAAPACGSGGCAACS